MNNCVTITGKGGFQIWLYIVSRMTLYGIILIINIKVIVPRFRLFLRAEIVLNFSSKTEPKGFFDKTLSEFVKSKGR